MTGRMAGGSEAATAPARPGGGGASAAGAGDRPVALGDPVVAVEPLVHLPSPSLWPAALGLGLALLGAGLLLHVALGVAGALLSAYAIFQWVVDLRRENAGDDERAPEARTDTPPPAAAYDPARHVAPAAVEDPTRGSSIHTGRTSHE